MSRAVFRTLLAVILLGLYIFALNIAIQGAQCTTGVAACEDYRKTHINDSLNLVLNGVGGVISALVIIELAVTPSGSAPSGHVFTGNGGLQFAKAMTVCYMCIWLFAGLVAFVVGVMQYPKVVPPLTDIGVAWLGLAITSIYSYFGINPPGTNA